MLWTTLAQSDRSPGCSLGGAGHNGQTAAAYLAEAGIDVCLTDKGPVVGGTASTEGCEEGKPISHGPFSSLSSSLL